MRFISLEESHTDGEVLLLCPPPPHQVFSRGRLHSTFMEFMLTCAISMTHIILQAKKRNYVFLLDGADNNFYDDVVALAEDFNVVKLGSVAD